MNTQAFSLIELYEKSSKNRGIPDNFCCKITYDIINAPLMTPDGISYEKSALFEHCNKMGSFDPITRHYFEYNPLIKNLALEEGIKGFLEQNPWAFESDDILDYNLVLL